jgi:hypothetical protein
MCRHSMWFWYGAIGAYHIAWTRALWFSCLAPTIWTIQQLRIHRAERCARTRCILFVPQQVEQYNAGSVAEASLSCTIAAAASDSGKVALISPCSGGSCAQWAALCGEVGCPAAVRGQLVYGQRQTCYCSNILLQEANTVLLS